MRFLFWILGLFVSAVGLAVVVRSSYGNVVFFWPPYRIDLSLNFFLLLLLFFYVLLFLVIKAIHLACKLPSEITAYRNRKKESESNQALKESLKAFFEGQFTQSGKMAEKAMEWEYNRACAAMIAAYAFHALRLPGRRDMFLETAERDPLFGTACRVTQAKWLIDDHKPLDALKVIDRLNAEGIQYLHLQQMSLEANRLAGNWSAVVELVHSLEPGRILPETVAGLLEKQACENILSVSAQDIETVKTIWKAVPADWQKKPSIALRAARIFYHAGLLDESRNIMTRALHADWDADLMCAYSEFSSEKNSVDLEKRIECCLQWEENYSIHPQWMLALGELYYRQNDFERARFYFERTLEKQPESSLLSRTHFLLAQLCEKSGQPEQAAYHYKKSSLVIQTESVLIAGQQE